MARYNVEYGFGENYFTVDEWKTVPGLEAFEAPSSADAAMEAYYQKGLEDAIFRVREVKFNGDEIFRPDAMDIWHFDDGKFTGRERYTMKELFETIADENGRINQDDAKLTRDNIVKEIKRRTDEAMNLLATCDDPKQADVIYDSFISGWAKLS